MVNTQNEHENYNLHYRILKMFQNKNVIECHKYFTLYWNALW